MWSLTGTPPLKAIAGVGPRPLKAPRATTRGHLDYTPGHLDYTPGKSLQQPAGADKLGHLSQPASQPASQNSRTSQNTARKRMAPSWLRLAQSEPALPLGQSRAAILGGVGSARAWGRGLEPGKHVLRLRAGRTFWFGRAREAPEWVRWAPGVSAPFPWKEARVPLHAGTWRAVTHLGAYLLVDL